MKDTNHSNLDAFFRTCAIAVLIASLLLAGRNTPANNTAPKSPVHTIKDHNLRIGNA